MFLARAFVLFSQRNPHPRGCVATLCAATSSPGENAPTRKTFPPRLLICIPTAMLLHGWCIILLDFSLARSTSWLVLCVWERQLAGCIVLRLPSCFVPQSPLCARERKGETRSSKMHSAVLFAWAKGLSSVFSAECPLLSQFYILAF